MADSGPLSRLLGSPKALAGLAGGLLAAAVVVVLVLVLSGGSKSNSGNELIQPHTTRLGQITLPPIDRSRQGLQSVYTAGSSILTNPAGEIAQAHALGFSIVRVDFSWASIAPDPTAKRVPHFDASDPAAYPAAGWAPYDTIARLLHQYGMRLDLVLAPYPPLWASTPGAVMGNASHPYWEPNAALFAKFVTAVGTRYSGHFRPKGGHSPLPRADFWSVWNEPNSGVQLAPQTVGSVHPYKNGTSIEVAPRFYRALADAAWSSLHATGHGSDTITFGDLAPVGGALGGAGGAYSVQAPLRFLRALYCVGSNLKPLSGATATANGCPATSAASSKFAAQNPILFHASDFAMHPYPQALAPDKQIPDAPDDVVTASLPKLFTTLDALQNAYGSHTRFDVYDLEYGYITTPPATQSGGTSPLKAAHWLNWSEYLSWRLPRMLSYDQYLFEDPPPVKGKPYNAFATGIQTYSGARKPGWYAIQLASWLPQTTQTATGKLEVWGCVRPAKNYPMGRRAPAEIQLRPRGGGAWKTIATVSTKTSEGYFDIDEHFPSSGKVRIRWSPPSGPAIESLTTAITVR